MEAVDTEKATEFGKRVIGLDIVRSVAVLSVVLHHFTHLWWRFAFAPLVLAGIYGVELFFVLSGFLIGGILFRQAKRDGFHRKDILHFWKRRWFRTLPNYVLFLGLFTIVAVLNHADLTGWWRYLFFLQNLFSSKYLIIYGVSWSLCVEEWSYIQIGRASCRERV